MSLLSLLGVAIAIAGQTLTYLELLSSCPAKFFWVFVKAKPCVCSFVHVKWPVIAKVLTSKLIPGISMYLQASVSNQYYSQHLCS